jgi:hypothetical protein
LFFKTNLSKNLYNSFTSHYKTFHHGHESLEFSPFVYVGNNGEMRFITMSQSEGSIFAQGMSNDGWVEYLEVNEPQ